MESSPSAILICGSLDDIKTQLDPEDGIAVGKQYLKIFRAGRHLSGQLVYIYAWSSFLKSFSVIMANISGYPILSVLAVTVETWLVAHEAQEGPTHTMALYRGVSFYSQMWFALLLYTMDAIFSVVLIIGAHRKNPHLLQAYFYFGITTTLASFVTLLVLAHHYMRSHWANAVLDGSMAFCGIALQTYLLLLVRTELKKLKQSSRMSFINHIAEVVVDAPRDDKGRNPL